jgi:hypothetical protein
MGDNLPAMPTRQKLAIDGRSRRNAVTGKLKAALDAMVWEAKDRKDAAIAAGLVDRSVRDALRKPHVVAYYNNELAALRTSLRAKNLHRLDGIADNSKNDMAKVASIKVLEQITDQADERRGAQGDGRLPGLQIIIVQPAPKPVEPIEVADLIRP